MSDQITNDAGQIALKWAIRLRPSPKIIKLDGLGVTYSVTSKHNIHMLWVEPAHLQTLLNLRMKSCACNNGTMVNAFRLASQLDVNLWTAGNREGIIS